MAMAYAILRVAKMKTMGNVGGHGSHVERQRETLNADSEKLKLNQRLDGTDDPMTDVQVRID
ncbi:Plasmid recombination enzyme [Spirosoma endophyticum]|uniref:Plasmid recombination enzyme n=1 Tax=Spirosoma endophyticum TaxID=662367 RepID=A0A1I2BFN8_9BACT|nr:Plasmid recombination enzyme [Spirosoma endophyticum]